MQIKLDTGSLESYRLFLKIKALPRYRIVGHTAEFPDEYSSLLGLNAKKERLANYLPLPALFDYQRDISKLAIRKKKFAAFVGCGYGKSLIMFEFARYAQAALRPNRRVLIIAPLMVVKQHIREAQRFYGDSIEVEQVRSNRLQEWLYGKGQAVGITNYEAITEDATAGNLGALILDESALLKSHYGKWGTRIIELGKGLAWKLCLTGLPAPNDRIEYANHAVFLDQFPTVNSFLARYFVNRGQTNERWELKPHALRPFYTSLSHWCIFMNSPGTYGWKDNAGSIPPINVHIHDVDMTEEQVRTASTVGGDLYGTPGGIMSRSAMSQIAKGQWKGQKIASNKNAFIRKLIESWPDESTLVWCKFNPEQDALAREWPDAANISGNTPEEKREEFILDFQERRRNVMISKPRCLGFGLNLQVATRQVFSTLMDSLEEFHQAVKRSNRVGSTLPLNVHLPVVEIEKPMVSTVLRKARQIEDDTAEQEALFKENANGLSF